MTTVLDASALLAYLKNEPGADRVEAALDESAISSVNWAEVVQKIIVAKLDVNAARKKLEAVGMTVRPFTRADAEMSGQLWAQTKSLGLSLGDRACLSLGLRLGAPVLTGDRAWQSLDLSVEVQLIR